MAQSTTAGIDDSEASRINLIIYKVDNVAEWNKIGRAYSLVKHSSKKGSAPHFRVYQIYT